MRYAVISDIHANRANLSRALERLRGTDEIICLGDIVGHGDADGCIDDLRSARAAGVAGGHDLEALIASREDAEHSDGLVWLDEDGRELREDFGLSAGRRSWLEGLPMVLRREIILDSPWLLEL